ncbi:MAG: hypothetical protein ACTHJ9_17185 [Rhodanobacter sp.]
MHHREPGIVVTLSREGLRRAANDNALKRATEASAVGEIVAYCAAMAGVVFFVAWFVDAVARALA